MVLGGLVVAIGVGACKDKAEPTPTSKPVDEYIADPISQRLAPPAVEFPDTLRSPDASLNAFIEELMQICTRGEYGLYRLAVAARYEPLGRTQFEKAWHAVQKVQIRNIKLIHQPTTRHTDPARTDIPEELKNPIYCVHGTITLREVEGRKIRRPVREVVLLIIKENGDWKLGPPANARIKHEIMGIQEASDDMVVIETGSSTRPAATRNAPATQGKR